MIRRKATPVSAVLSVILFSDFTQETPVPGGTGKMRISLIPRSDSEWNRKVPNATQSGVECHSSSGAKHRRRATPELNARSRLHRPQGVPRNLARCPPSQPVRAPDCSESPFLRKRFGRSQRSCGLASRSVPKRGRERRSFMEIISVIFETAFHGRLYFCVRPRTNRLLGKD